ncbi:MAG: hypothetical protein LBG61_05320 [Burkholderiales bacterium]|jgi:hypothetical protein|nr:hypothetical protein [Burkholderiales bacterium]
MSKIVKMIVLGGVVFGLVGCQLMAEDKRKEEEMKRNTFVCQYDGGRLLVRFDRDEIRILTPEGERIYLYRAQSSAGQVYYTNGQYELLGKATDISFGMVGNRQKLDCKPYDTKDQDQLKEDKKNLKEF